MKRAALYVRVSTLEQANEGYSVSEQRERLVAFCKAHDWLVADVYVDGGYSGANLDRPGIQKLIADVRSFDVVLVYKLDRLSRSQRDTLYLIEEVFLPCGVDFVSMSESFDTSVPFGRAMIGILSVFAQLEREQIRERTRMGHLARAKEGLWHGGVYTPIGYDYVGGVFVINEYEALQVRKCYEWYLDGMSPEKIAERLRAEGFTNRYGSWEYGTGVLRVLSNNVYLGTRRYADVVVENAHPAIVERDAFDKVQSVRAKRHEVWGDTAYMPRYLLSGMIFCARCGGRYFAKKVNKNYSYYVCYSRAKTVKRMVKSENCDNKIWKIDDLEGIVKAQIENVIFQPDYAANLQKEHRRAVAAQVKPKGDAEIIEGEIAALDRKIGRLMDLYADATIPAAELSAKIDALYREKVALSERLAVYVPPAPPADFNDGGGIETVTAELALLWDMAGEKELRQIIQTLVNRIVIDGDSVKIEWAFLDA